MVRAFAYVAAPVLAIAIIVQVTSYALFGGIAAPASVPAHLVESWPFDLARTGLGAIPAFRRELARAALVRGDTARASALLVGAGTDDDAEDLRGALAAATSDDLGAVRHFGRAGDIVAARQRIDAVAARDPAAALRLADAFDRATANRDVPAAVIAQSDWRAGQLAAAVAAQSPATSAALVRQSLAKYEAAAHLDPTQEAYGLAVGFESIVAGDATRARDAYARVAALDPQSVDAAAGLAVADALTSTCAAATQAYARAQTLASQQNRVVDVAGSGYAPAVRAALARCLAHAAP